MSNYPRITDIDWLRQNHQMIHFFGLGFIQLKLDDSHRMHFYTTKFSPIIEDTEVHNHRYDFASYILKGCLLNTIYGWVPSPLGDKVKEAESCQVNVKAVGNPEFGFLVNSYPQVNPTGCSYKMDFHQFHKVKAEEDTITSLVRASYKQEYAHVIRDIGAQKTCPFSKSVPEYECWEIVEDMLKELK